MKKSVLIAIPNCQGRVSPVFDVAARLLLVRFEGRKEMERKDAMLVDSDPRSIARNLFELRVGVLICGAISQLLHTALTKAGVRVIPDICGELEAVLQAHRSGTLDAPEFQMPGCCAGRWDREPLRRQNKISH